MKKILWILGAVVTLIIVTVIGGSFYMLDYSLAPDSNRTDRDSCFRQQFREYPESKEWVGCRRCRSCPVLSNPQEEVHRSPPSISRVTI
ncbi:MAG: hypothetical protein IKO17_03755 [Prevotella sp.]|nr:hypothetical protein [Prevotella sp.]